MDICKDPYRTSVFLDTCAFDPMYDPEQLSAFKIHSNHLLNTVLVHSPLKENSHLNTPVWVKEVAEQQNYRFQTNVTPEQERLKTAILDILVGNGHPPYLKQDAMHIFEAHKYKGYFVTTDNRILDKKYKLEQVTKATIVRPSELQSVIESYYSRHSFFSAS